ncbi:protein of unknown function [Pseudomonas sp. JV551A1]|nr:protein of unknown function [Pseudomonas sp. JV551A1]
MKFTVRIIFYARQSSSHPSDGCSKISVAQHIYPHAIDSARWQCSSPLAENEAFAIQKFIRTFNGCELCKVTNF